MATTARASRAKKIASIPASASTGANASAEDADDVLVQQFTHELASVLRLVRETKRSTVDSVVPPQRQHQQQPRRDATVTRDDADNDADEVAYYGPLAQKLVELIDRLLHHTHELAWHKKLRLLLDFGDRFLAQHEFRAASRFFFRRVVAAFDAPSDSETERDGPNDQGLDENDSHTDAVVAATSTRPSLPKNDVYIRALYGSALCQFYEQKRRDALVRHPGTLEKMLVALRRLQSGMETATALERAHASSQSYAWLVLNGSVLIFSIARPLSSLGFARDVVAFLKWTILSTESVVSLSTTKYILWRMQLFAATCECYEAMAHQAHSPKYEAQHLHAALQCAEYAQKTVLRLKKEEELDLPLPKDVAATLAQAQTAASMLVARAAAAASREPLSKRQVEAALPSASSSERIRVAVDALERLAQSDKDCVGALSAPSTPQIATQTHELLAYVLEMATPLLSATVPPTGTGADGRSSEQTSTAARSSVESLEREFPLAFHLMLLRHCFRLGKLEELQSLVASARTNVALPPARSIQSLAKALTACLNHRAGTLSRVKRDLVSAAALLLWRELAQPMIHELDANDPSELSKRIIRVASDGLLAVHLAMHETDLDDVVVHGHVGLRLTMLLRLQRKFRLATQTLRALLDRINRKRDELAQSENHFDATTTRDARTATALSCATMSCAVDHTLSHSDAIAADAPTARDRVGVFGTGSQFGSVHHDICCLQADVLLLLFQTELDEASASDALPTSAAGSGAASVEASPFESLSLVKLTEERLLLECRKNNYAKVLLSIQRMRHRPNSNPRENAALAEQSMKLLERIETQERELQARAKKLASAATTRSRDAAATDTGVPLAPVVVARSSTAIRVRVLELNAARASVRKRKVAYYMVFAKPSGAGTAVSLNNNELPGTAEPLYAPRLCVTVGGLVPNESYVFAVAAFDANHDVIQGIGQTSSPVVALHPLSTVLCYGYLAQACYDLALVPSSARAATALYNTIVSRAAASRVLWRASPYYRHALKRDVVSTLPVPVLNVAVQAILILCHDEAGDPERDGMLHDAEHRSLLAKQVDVLEASRRVAIGVELASAAANTAAIRALCFKGYRILLPLLHLHQSNGLTFAPLVTLYHALLTIPRADWDVDTKSIFARVAFELFRIGLQSRHLGAVLVPSVVRESQLLQDANDGSASSNELQSLGEVVAIYQAMIGKTADVSAKAPGLPVVATAGATAATASAGKTAAPVAAASGAKSAASSTSASASTPQSTPRPHTSGGSGDDAPKLPPLTQILQQAGYNVHEALKLLETLATTASTDVRYAEYACKLACIAIQSGDDSAASACLAAIKLRGSPSNVFRQVVSALGGEHLLPAAAAVSAGDDANAQSSAPPDAGSAPPTARSVKSPRQSGNSSSKAPKDDAPAMSLSSHDPTTDALPSPVPSLDDSSGRHESGRDDDDVLFLWSGEVFFLEALVLFRRLVSMRTADAAAGHSVDVLKGPSFDAAFDLLHGAASAISRPLPEPAGVGSTETMRGDLATPAIPSDSSDTTLEPGASSDSTASAADDERIRVFADFLAKMSAACTLFRHGKAWQALQATCHALLQTAFASTAVVTTATSVLSADVTWIVHFVTYVVRALCAQEQWTAVVRVGKTFHELLGHDDASGGSRFSELNFPVLLFAQRQLLEQASALLSASERDLATFVREFTESEAKKKKKKSRLVVEEVLTPEEVAFRAQRAAMETRIQGLVEVRDRERAELEQLARTYDSLTKSMNKCVQALDAAHDLVETYRRRYAGHASSSAVADAHASLKSEIIGAYTHCILLARQKRQQRPLCQAYQELGDFYLATSRSPNAHASDVKLAVKSWLEGLDNAFGTLNAVQSWRDAVMRGVKEHAVNGVSGAEQIQGDSLYVALLSCTALSKLVLHTTAANCYQALEYALMAATIFTRIFASSLPHPTRAFLFGSYELGHELWPGRELVGSSECISPCALALTLTLIPEVLLQYEYYASTAMPLVAGYEFVARYTLESKSHVANARRLRVEALAQSGRMREALETLSRLFDSVDAVSAREQIKPNAVVPLVAFHDDKPLPDEANASALAWLVAIDVHRLHADLAQSYASPLVLEILLTVLRVVVRLARHESNFADGVSPLRAVADKVALTILELLDHSLSAQPPPSTEDRHHATVSAATWDTVHFASMRSEVVLQQSYLAFLDGQWALARDLSEKAMARRVESVVTGARESPASSSHSTPSSALVVPLDLDQELKCCFFRRASTFVARCRLQALQCDFVQGRWHALLEQAAVAQQECRASGEEHVSEQIELLRAQALVFLGERERAEVALEQLRAAATARHTNCSLVFVRVLLALSTVLRARALLAPTSSSAVLHTALDRLVEAEHALDNLLERDGWIGVGSTSTANADLSIEKRLNLYSPAVPVFVVVKAALAQTLVECVVDSSPPSMEKAARVMRVINSGLHATLHTARRVGAANALLLLLKGAVLKKMLVHDARRREAQLQQAADAAHKHRRDELAHIHDDSDTAVADMAAADARRAQMFADAATALRESIETSMQRGGYDRRLIRMALLELVDLYSQKLLPGDEDEHTQAAFHYLSLAVAAQSHEFTLFETLELQSGTITALEKLPTFITQAIAEESGEASMTSGAGHEKRAEPPAPQAATASGKKPAAASAGPSTGGSSSAPMPDTAHVINYFVRLQREQHVLPVCNDVQHESVQWLHTFLLQHHSSYATSCCFSELPSVPTADPEIKASLVCAQWGRDLTPAIAATASSDALPAVSSPRLTLFFTLGTTRIEIRCDEAHAAAATSRMERFLHEPLLSHKPGLDESHVNRIRIALSRLRTRIEDDESLVIDRSTFESELVAILRSVQQLFQPHRSAIAPVAANESADASAPRLADAFGNPIDVSCSLETVRCLEHLFTVERGISTSDNVLCYFLRDLLASDSEGSQRSDP